jgi:RNA polymerase-binding transcription factor
VDSKPKTLDKTFIEQQRQRLIKLRDELTEVMQGKVDEEQDLNSDASGQAAESEDDAQRLTALELDGNLVVRNATRLAQVKRALEKIAEGSYGLSDASNQAIPVQRLEVTPEAIYTVAEQAAREAAGR